MNLGLPGVIARNSGILQAAGPWTAVNNSMRGPPRKERKTKFVAGEGKKHEIFGPHPSDPTLRAHTTLTIWPNAVWPNRSNKIGQMWSRPSGEGVVGPGGGNLRKIWEPTNKIRNRLTPLAHSVVPNSCKPHWSKTVLPSTGHEPVWANLPQSGIGPKRFDPLLSLASKKARMCDIGSHRNMLQHHSANDKSKMLCWRKSGNNFFSGTFTKLVYPNVR